VAKLVFERAIHVNNDGSFSSYWEEYWSIKKLAERWLEGPAFFAASYQNDPSALEGTLLKADWVHYYLVEDLKAARAKAGLDPDTGHGVIHTGNDTAAGGLGRNPDYCSGVAIEVIDNRAFILPDMLNARLEVEKQAPEIELWWDRINPTFAIVEETSARGFVKTDLETGINDGLGSKHTFTVETPQSKSAGGDKSTRFLAMSPRFMNTQVLVPGIMLSTGEIVCDPRCEMWFSEWKSYPSGHDDLLDATYWAIWSAFKDSPAVGVSKDEFGHVTGEKSTATERLCEREAHVAYNRPVEECIRCSMEQGLYEERSKGIGVPQFRRREHMSMLRGR